MKFFCLLTCALSVEANAQNTIVDKFLATTPSIKQIHEELYDHKFSCKDLINGYMDRIRVYNLTTNNTAPLNSITQLNPNALFDAENLDKTLVKDKVSSKSLFCIPVIVKDNIDVSGLRTSSGSLSLLRTYPLADAEIIKNIKVQGGIILAKSSMDELASGLSGMSSLSGRIGNAYNTEYNSGGSSGGSAVSVASGFAPLSIGTDNSGSVRIPAAYNGLYGLRPTYGLISHNGIFPLGNLDGTAGPMATNVQDMAQLLTIMTNNKFNYTKQLNTNSLQNKHFAIIKSVSGKPLWESMPESIAKIYRQVKSNLESQGVTISEIDLPGFNLERKYNMAGTSDEVNNYLAHNISDIDHMSSICYGNTRIFGKTEECLKFITSIKHTNSSQYKDVIKAININHLYISQIMGKLHLDGLILPSGKSGIADYNASNIGDQSIIASNSGLPEITIPVAQYKGLPVGLEIIGPKYSESSLLNYAYSYQKYYYSFKAPGLIADPQFISWEIKKLNTLYQLIGKMSFDTVIKINNKNNIIPITI